MSLVYMWYTGVFPEDSEVKSRLMRQNSIKSTNPPEESAHHYESFESWLEEFKIGAGSVNQLLADSDKGNLIDFMDHAPLRRAFADNKEPRQLGVEVGKQFDFAKFFRGKQS